jgi:hypothetical protein
MVLGKKLGYRSSISTGKVLKSFGGPRFSSRENDSLFSRYDLYTVQSTGNTLIGQLNTKADPRR